jgi:hypothetical protein
MDQEMRQVKINGFRCFRQLLDPADITIPPWLFLWW